MIWRLTAAPFESVCTDPDAAGRYGNGWFGFVNMREADDDLYSLQVITSSVDVMVDHTSNRSRPMIPDHHYAKEFNKVGQSPAYD